MHGAIPSWPESGGSAVDDFAMIARFTPSLLDPATLEALFVGREHLVADGVNRIQRAATSGERASRLFVGPRGSGKTHLVSLTFHRASRLPEFGSDFQLAWLPEDLWTVASYQDLLEEVLQRVDPPLVDVKVSDEQGAEALVIEAARRNGPIVVLIENLDQVLEGIGTTGQARLRALLEGRSLLFVATTTRLTRYLFDQAEPFYGFFDTCQLTPFDLNQSTEMLRRIAHLNSDTETEAGLTRPSAQHRLAAVSHLTGGQPRIWAVLGSALTIKGLDELVPWLIERLDDLTPYYQEQLARLSMNERKVVKALADANGTMSVRAIAESTGIEQRSMAKTISDLTHRGWIAPHRSLLTDMVDRRLTFYELAEPLARVAFQIKSSRGRPVELIIEFLKAWFDLPDLHSQPTARVAIVNEYVATASTALATDPTAALYRSLTGQPPAGAALDVSVSALDDAIAALSRGDATALLKQPTAILNLVERRLERESPAAVRLSVLRLVSNNFDPAEMIGRLNSILPDADGDYERAALLQLGLWHLRADEPGPADALLDRVIEESKSAGGASPLLVEHLTTTGETLLEIGENRRAVTLLEAARNRDPAARSRVSQALAAAYFRLAGFEDAVTELCSLVDVLAGAFSFDDERTLAARENMAYAHRAAGRIQQGIEGFEAVLSVRERLLGPEHPDTLTTRAHLATSYWLAGHIDKATELGEQVLADRERVLGSNHLHTLITRGSLSSYYHAAGRVTEAIDLGERVLADFERVRPPDDAYTLTARANLASWYHSAGRIAEAKAIEEQVLADSERLLGHEHPDSLTARANLAAAYRSEGRVAEAIDIEEEVATARQRLLGPEHPDTLIAELNLASSYHLAGRTAEAIAIKEQAVAALERVLGPEHPHTLTARANLAVSYHSAGRVAEAIALGEQVLADRERPHGPQHPDALVARANLASMYRSAGRVADAIAVEG
jgi:tetratricopeptide (TPR) repeat protein/DNA-binding MarR family transcriptional regulator